MRREELTCWGRKRYRGWGAERGKNITMLKYYILTQKKYVNIFVTFDKHEENQQQVW